MHSIYLPPLENLPEVLLPGSSKSRRLYSGGRGHVRQHLALGTNVDVEPEFIARLNLSGSEGSQAAGETGPGKFTFVL